MRQRRQDGFVFLGPCLPPRLAAARRAARAGCSDRSATCLILWQIERVASVEGGLGDCAPMEGMDEPR
jgi:hypothetical protein